MKRDKIIPIHECEVADKLIICLEGNNCYILYVNTSLNSGDVDCSVSIPLRLLPGLKKGIDKALTRSESRDLDDDY